MSTGNSVDFGDKTDHNAGGGGASNGHGGFRIMSILKLTI